MKRDPGSNGMDDLIVWFRPIVHLVLRHLDEHGHTKLDLDAAESDLLDEVSAVTAWDWWQYNQEPHDYDDEGAVSDTVDRAEQRALQLVRIIRGMGGDDQP